MIKKVKIEIHNRIEKRVKINSRIDIETFLVFLIREVFKNIDFNSNKEIFYKTEIAKSQKPVVLSQARLISLLCDGFSCSQFPIKDRILIERLSNYLVSLENDKNLFELNNLKWDKQDEGIASVWGAIALIKTYELTQQKYYLEASLTTFNSMLRYLYSPKTGLVHTMGQDYWCINASSKFAYLCSLL